MVGVRLITYDNYLSSMLPLLQVKVTKMMPFMKLMAKATPLIGGSASGANISKINDLAGSLSWCRDHYGYDLVFSWTEIDRPARKFAALLEDYRGRGIVANMWKIS